MMNMPEFLQFVDSNVNVNDNVNTKLYNMSGQPVTRTYRGVVIQNARKVLR